MTSRPLRITLYVAAIVATAVVAISAGRWYGHHHVISEVLAEQFDFLDEQLQGIEIGDPFPHDFVLWETDGVTSHYIEDLYPIDVLFFLGSRECGTCAAAVDTLWQLLGKSERHPRVVLVVDDPPEFLSKPMADKGIDIPLYRDMRHALRADYGAPAGHLGNRIYFRLDKKGVVEGYGRIPNSYAELQTILKSV